ncbi:MAG: Holliday junction branch migration protein RuvA [Clostridiales bacterium]|nr:Holliday junction branch migration protein RuvA [Clostridia bacterium]MCR5353574.1 Holliday junction branch migration protein RuvA [Clostridiales bacterium]
MYYYLSGTLALLEPDKAVIDCGGVGYIMTIAQKTFDKLAGDAFLPDGNISEIPVKLYTYYNTNEYSSELYGFYSEKERNVFKLLIGVSGVGPKAAIAVLSALEADDFVKAVLTQDAKAISFAQGIGPKVSQKIILELKDKLSSYEADFDGITFENERAPSSDIAREAVNALTVLGYSKAEAMRAVKNAKGETLEEVIRNALALMM